VRNRLFAASVLAVSLVGTLFAAQLPYAYRQYPGVEYPRYDLPKDLNEGAEWIFARLMYRPTRIGPAFRWYGDWSEGGTSWTVDYPRGDRHMAEAVQRLTRVNARSFEQPVNLDNGDDVFNWPWLYAVEVGWWDLTDQQTRKLRDYLLRGGFLMVDDFHGTREWSVFMASMQRVFPDRVPVDIPDDDPIFHTLWDLDDRFQVPGLQYLYSRRTYENDGYEAKWRAIYDDNGRIMVAICFNSDLGDSVEHYDTPVYPQKLSAKGMQIFLNYLVYSLSH
jgi:hypothetical protein